MESIKPYFLGVSSYLHEEAVGHYLGVHTEYHNELDALLLPNRYLGSNKGQGRLDWVDPIIGYIPTKFLNYDQIISQMKLLFHLYRSSSVGGKIFVFEGNLNYWFFLCLVSRLKKNTAHINLIRSDLVYKKLILGNNPIYKMLVMLCSYLGKNRVSVSTFSTELSNKLNELYPINATRIPTFSGFIPKIRSDVDLLICKNVLIFAPYLQDLERLLEILEEFPKLINEVTVATWQPDKVIESLKSKGVRVLNSHLSDSEYELLLLKSKHIVLLYLNEFHKFGSSSKVYDCVMVNRGVCVPRGTEVSNQAIDCANYFIFNGSNNEDVFNAIKNPKFINNQNSSNVATAAHAIKYVFSVNTIGANKFSFSRTMLIILFFINFLCVGLFVSFIMVFANALKRLLRKFLIK